MAIAGGWFDRLRNTLNSAVSRRPSAERESRLPPGQHRVAELPVLDLGIHPDIPAAAWRLTVDGLVEAPLVWDWDAFLAQPLFRDTSDVHCGTGWSHFDNAWEGVSARHLLSMVRPLPGAAHVICHGGDGYATNLPLAAFNDDDVVLAFRRNGRPIPREHGGPVRLVVPKRWFWKSAKWIVRLEFTDHDRPGHWEALGYDYDNEADIRRPPAPGLISPDSDPEQETSSCDLPLPSLWLPLLL